jgi:cytochrome oxidase assembly protein ShyY1
LALITLAACVLFVFLGRWQWHRHEDRRERNAQVEAALEAPVEPLNTISTSGSGLSPTDEYRQVTVSGQYDSAGQVLQRNPKGRSGFNVLTPLVTGEDEAILVNRGWVPGGTTDTNTPDVDVTPPPGTIEAVVRMRVSEGSDGRTAPEGQTYTIDVSALGISNEYTLVDAYGELVEQEPPPPSDIELPETQPPGLGPHQMYAYQWWLFVPIAIIGFVLLARRESQTQRHFSR